MILAFTHNRRECVLEFGGAVAVLMCALAVLHSVINGMAIWTDTGTENAVTSQAGTGRDTATCSMYIRS